MHHNTSMCISKFHYLTQDLPGISHQELAEIACKNGVRWLQLRVKNKDYNEWLQIAKEVKQICLTFQTTFIINDNVEIAKEVDADGVHLGKNDSSILEARKTLGNSKIIGATANTIQDILEHQTNGVNYIGLGPYKFTHTKEKLNPILGLDGYSRIIKSSDAQIKIPIIAIGGIQLEDVKPLINTGVYGVAVSSVINLSNQKEKMIDAFLKELSL
jgi:thiamine-phosphate pyrophosphorylase